MSSEMRTPDGRWIPAIPEKASWEKHWWSRAIHRWRSSRPGYGRYVCTLCGYTERAEREVSCRMCGYGEMVFRRWSR